MKFSPPSLDMLSGWMKKAVVSLLTMFICLTCTAMTPISDADLSDVTGQALFQLNKQSIGSFTYYRMALDVEMDLNLNIANLQLGRTSTGTDISGTNVSFGCVADASNNCITSGAATAKSKLKDFVLMRPYIEFAIKNDNNATTREVSGVRLGAESVNGPLSFGTLSTFSGYLNGTTNIDMYGTCSNPLDNSYCTSGGTNRGIPATPPCPPTNCQGSPYVGQPAGGTGYDMGLANTSATLLGIGAWLSQLAIGFPGQTVQDSSGNTNIPVAASGSRLYYATIPNINFDTAINNLANNINVDRTTSALGTGLINLLLPILIGGVTNNIKGQIQSGMNPSNPSSVNLAALSIPYRLNNIHQLDISASNFGLSFQKESLTYPGYTDASGATVNMPIGWSMYAKNAFTLTIQKSAWNFTSAILSGAARQGNIVSLPLPYNNCWGASNFC